MLTKRLPRPVVCAIRRFNTKNGNKSQVLENKQGNPDEEVFHKWSVVPTFRGRSVTTNRMWMSRFLDKKTISTQKYEGNTPKSMRDSYVEEYLPFKTDLNTKIRVGKLFEDLDALAGSIAYTHCDDGTQSVPSVTIVTASVDRIDLLKPSIPSDQDLRLSGFVSFVGTSSMEVVLTVEVVPEGVEAAMANATQKSHSKSYPELALEKPRDNLILLARFTMVARDSQTSKAVKVNPLRLDTEFERSLNRLGAENKARRQVAAQTALTRLPPSVEEMGIIHQLYMEQKKYKQGEKPGNVVYMKDTVQHSLTICMPQDRNIHNNIFGGYLMRQAYELGYSTALLYYGQPVAFVGSEDIIFKEPVPIGSLLSLTGKVVYVVKNMFYVQVYADVIDPHIQTKSRTNEFFFKFRVDGEPRKVVPQSYDESMELISGRRKSREH